MPKPSDRDAEFQARLEEFEHAEECLAVLDGFAETAMSPIYSQRLIPDDIKGQLLGALVKADPVMRMLSGSNSLPFMELLRRLQGDRHQRPTQVRAFDRLISTREPITYEELLPLVNGVRRPLHLGLQRFRRRYRLPAANRRHVLTVRLTDPVPAEDPREAHPNP